jgi:hypothetical protein
MLFLFFLEAFGRRHRFFRYRELPKPPLPLNACEICESGREYTLLVMSIYGPHLAAGEEAVRSWCRGSYANDTARCEHIVADHYRTFLRAFRERIPMHTLCASLEYCRPPGRRFSWISRAADTVIDREPTDDLFRYLERAVTDEELERLIADSPQEHAVLAQMIPSRDFPLILTILERGSKRALAWYFRDRSEWKGFRWPDDLK